MKKYQTIILDSSVIAKWIFPEESSEIALVINDRFIAGQLSIAAPILLYYEINNILKSTFKSLRIKPAEALQAYEDFMKLNIVTYSSESLMKKALEIALEFDISSYDASYLALAEELQIPFVTSDQKLLNKVKNKFMIKLQDYKT